MSLTQRPETSSTPTNGTGTGLYGNAFLLARRLTTGCRRPGCRPRTRCACWTRSSCSRHPERNLATFVTTWMEPEAQRVIAENLHRNYIDHAEYPQTAEIEQRCIRMLADLFHAPGETTGARTQGSSEAIMLGALTLKWKWRGGREAAGKPTDRPNLVFGGDVHVVWEKFCRYFDVEPRIIPLQAHKFRIGPEDVEPHIDENTIGVAAVLGTTFTGHADDIVGIDELLRRLSDERGLDVPMHVDGASGGFVWPFLYPDSEWDFRLETVRSINVSGHKYGLVYPGLGWLIFRERTDLPEDLVFYENYLGKRDMTFTLNFSTGLAMVLAQYYNFVRYGHEGYRYIMESMQRNARALAEQIARIGPFELVGRRAPSSCRWSPSSSPRRATTTSSTSPPSSRPSAVDAARLHAAAERRARDDHARARQADARPLAGEDARRGHRPGLRDARGQGRAARARAQAGEDRHRLLKKKDAASRALDGAPVRRRVGVLPRWPVPRLPGSRGARAPTRSTFFVGFAVLHGRGRAPDPARARRARGGGSGPRSIQSAGTIFFNLTTFRALDTSLSNPTYDALVWRPDAFGSICFLVSGVIGYHAAAGRGWQPAVNLLGCVLFGLAAVAGYVVPAHRSMLDLAAANWTTSAGAACFLACALAGSPPSDDAHGDDRCFDGPRPELEEKGKERTMPLMRRRRPLMRAAMVGGGAYVAGKHAQRGAQQEADQNAQISEPQQQQQSRRPPAPYAPPPAAAPAAPAAPRRGRSRQLTQLKGLLDAGVLTQAEFDAQKQRILAGGMSMNFGPMQLLVVGFDGGEFKGEIMAELRRLREHDVVRLVDLLVVNKADDG